MAATTQTDYVTFLKEWYRGSVVADLTYDNHPYLGLVPKKEEVRGNVYVKPIRYANTTGRSALFATAHANVGAASRERWEMSHVNNYSKAAVENKVIELSQGDSAAFASALTDEIDAAHGVFADDLDFELHGTSTENGVRSLLGTQTSGGLIIDLNPGEARFFEKGMVLQHAIAAAPTVPADAGEEEVVAAVDRANDTITLVADWTTGFVATDRIFVSGDLGVKADSLKAWLPGSGVSTALNGVTRTADPTRLAGVDGVKGTLSGLLITDSLVQTGAAIMKEGGKPNLILLAPADFADLALETEARGRYAKLSATTGSISFSALEIQTGAGAVPCVADPAVTADQGFMLDTRTIELFSAGMLPSMFNRDGNFYHRTESADEISFYLYGFYNQSIQQPGRCSWIQDMY